MRGGFFATPRLDAISIKKSEQIQEIKKAKH